MEKPLLTGEASGHGGAIFSRRSDAIAFGSSCQKAAALVDLAEDGIRLPEEILEQSNFQSVAKLYFLFTRLDFIWTANYFALIILNFIEKPLWCYKSNVSCSDKDYYFLGQLPYLTGLESLIYEGITLLILIIHTFFPLSYEGARIYWKLPVNLLKIAGLVLLVADLVVFLFFFHRWLLTRFLSGLHHMDLRSTLVILAGMLDTYLNVLVALVALATNPSFHKDLLSTVKSWPPVLYFALPVISTIEPHSPLSLLLNLS